MLRNHLKFAVRLFVKDGVYSILNLLGLTLGISVGIVLLLYLQNEFSYDGHHEKKNQIYRFTHHRQAPGADFNSAGVPRELGPILKEEIPDVLNYVRFIPQGRTLVTLTEDGPVKSQFYEDRVAYADSSLLSVFTHDVLEGNPVSCLAGPDKVVLTRLIASKYFGEEKALGQRILFPDGEQRIVSAVISDLPDNSHYKYQILLSGIERRNFGSEVRHSEQIWSGSESYTYLLMPVDYDVNRFYDGFKNVFDKYYASFGKVIPGEATATPKLQALTEIHFGSIQDGDEPVGQLNFVFASACIGFFIVVLACINYTNLATARSVIRSREIGIRKVLGYSRIKLFGAILTEAMALAFIAMLLSLLICYLVLEFTPFNSWIDKKLSLDVWNNPILLPGTILVTLMIGLFSGFYPAVYIPSLPILTVTKGLFVKGSRATLNLRKGLLIFQFVISIAVILITVLMKLQLDYLKGVDPGYDHENLVMVDLRDTVLTNRIELIKNELTGHPAIIAASLSYGGPAKQYDVTVFRVERDGELVQQEMAHIVVDHSYLETMGMELVQGRDFISGNEADYRKSFIINEAAVKRLGWSDDPLSKRIRYFHENLDNHVIGVVRDFNFESLHSQIEPLFISLEEPPTGTLNVRIGGDIEVAIAHIGNTFKKFDPHHFFEFSFLDRILEQQFRKDQIQQKLVTILAYICIFISILGLIGLSAFTAGQRSREICIRKVLGASVNSILMMFSRGYSTLILISMIMAIPVAHYFVSEWLAGFAYQMTVQWYYYLFPGIMVLCLAMAIVMLQSLKTARTNPAVGLRNE